MENVNFFSYDSLFSSRLRDLLNKKIISMQALSAEIGVSRQAISQYCDGSTVPNADKLLKIAEYFGVSLDYLVGRTDTPTTDRDLRAVCDYTGLSDRAIEKLHQYTLGNHEHDVFREEMFSLTNKFIENYADTLLNIIRGSAC